MSDQRKVSDLVVVDSDLSVSLKDLKSMVGRWIDTYGEDSVLMTDAGFNNVDLVIQPVNNTGEKR